MFVKVTLLIPNFYSPYIFVNSHFLRKAFFLHLVQISFGSSFYFNALHISQISFLISTRNEYIIQVTDHST